MPCSSSQPRTRPTTRPFGSRDVVLHVVLYSTSAGLWRSFCQPVRCWSWKLEGGGEGGVDALDVLDAELPQLLPHPRVRRAWFPTDHPSQYHTHRTVCTVHRTASTKHTHSQYHAYAHSTAHCTASARVQPVSGIRAGGTGHGIATA
eukprot:2786620-Rhodomonas_salina.1